MTGKMLLSAPGILTAIRKEHRFLEHLIDEKKIDAVISDNRFGLWSKRIPSVYITHQLMIKAPEKYKFTESLLHKIHRQVIRQYDECWVPDLEGPLNLSGDLSHLYPISDNIKFIGPLSRFSDRGPIDRNLASDRIELVALISGPEPQRSILEKILTYNIQKWPVSKAIILQGKPDESGKKMYETTKLSVYNHLPDEELRDILLRAERIICRAGYSTIMDLVSLGKNALLVPTPGQTEQEYLALYHSEKGQFSSCKQDEIGNLDFGHAFNENSQTKIFSNPGHLLDQRIDDLLARIRV